MSWALVEPYLDQDPPPRFFGWRSAGGAAFVVARYCKDGVVQSLPLPPRRDLRDHSPGGYEWGYSGSGPSQLALAMAAFVLEDDEAAQRCYQWLKAEIVAIIPQCDGWHLEIEEVRKFCLLVPARVS